MPMGRDGWYLQVTLKWLWHRPTVCFVGHYLLVHMRKITSQTFSAHHLMMIFLIMTWKVSSDETSPKTSQSWYDPKCPLWRTAQSFPLCISQPAGFFWNPLTSAVNWAGKATLYMFSHSHSCQGQRVWCLLFGRKSSESTAFCSCQPSGQLVTGSGNPSRSFPSECRMW